MRSITLPFVGDQSKIGKPIFQYPKRNWGNKMAIKKIPMPQSENFGTTAGQMWGPLTTQRTHNVYESAIATRQALLPMGDDSTASPSSTGGLVMLGAAVLLAFMLFRK